jgi:triacylglycerol lipase
MANRREDARLGLLAQAAYVLTGLESGPAPPIPALDPGWIVRGHLTASAELFRGVHSDDRFYYGYVAESAYLPGTFIVAIRGTANALDWAKDAEFALRGRANGERVESGFDDVYQSMLLDGKPVVTTLQALVGVGSVTVLGHSLGAALAIYLTADLARAGVRARGRFYAPPHPGDAVFAENFDRNVDDYMCYAYELDAVPHLPFGLGYTHLPKFTSITPKTSEARVKFDFGCHHYLWCYVSMLCYEFLDEAKALVDVYKTPKPACPNCITRNG